MLTSSRSLSGFAALALLVTLGGLHPAPRTQAPVTSEADTSSKTKAVVSRLPLYFIENQGQVDRRVSYYLHGKETSAYFTSQGLFITMPQGRDTEGKWNLGLEFAGASRVHPKGKALTPAVVSYFIGHPSRWKTDIPTYRGVSYPDLWEGIDLSFAGTSNRLKYSFLVDPGANPKNIRLSYRGATSLRVKGNGELEVVTPAGSLVDERPTAHQVVGGRSVSVPVTYALGKGRAYGFRLGPYDRTRPLVIDPALFVYAGFIGGSGDDTGSGIAVDQAGNAYVTGRTASTEATFPAAGGPDTSHNGGFPSPGMDAFVAKVAASGTSLVYAGFIGGTGTDPFGDPGIDFGEDIAVDQAGNAYITGGTTSTDFPVAGGPDLTKNGLLDAFVAKVAASGTSLVYAGYIGGSGTDDGFGIAVDQGGNAYVAGDTTSTDFPVAGGPDLTHNGPSTGFDAFVAKVAASGASLVYAGFIGGSDTDFGADIVVDQSGNAYVTGDAASTDFPVAGGPDLTHNGPAAGFDAYVAKVAASGASLAYAGYIGGSDADFGDDIAVDQAGNAYIVGSTSTTDGSFPNGGGFGTLPGPDLTHNGGRDAFVAKVAASGASLIYAGYIGGSAEDFGDGIAVDQAGNVYVSGRTNTNDGSFPDGDGFGTLPGPDLTHNGPIGGRDAFVAKVAPSGTALLYAGFIGGSGEDVSNSIAVDQAGSAYVTGRTETTDGSFPDGDGFGTVPSPDLNHNGSRDAFVAKIADTFCLGRPVTLLGTTSAETLTGTPGPDVIVALGGDDRIDASGGDDVVCAGDGTDVVIGGAGSDKLDGEAGTDTASFPGSTPTIASLAAGIATGAGTDTLAGFENLTGGSAKDSFRGDGNGNVLRGEGGKDRLFGSRGPDRLLGGRGKDRLFGGRGKDRLVGGKGADFCDGGRGRDKASGCERLRRIP